MARPKKLETKITKSIRMEESQWEELAAKAEKDRRTISQAVRDLSIGYIAGRYELGEPEVTAWQHQSRLNKTEKNS